MGVFLFWPPRLGREIIFVMFGKGAGELGYGQKIVMRTNRELCWPRLRPRVRCEKV